MGTSGADEYVIMQRYMRKTALFTFAVCTPYVGMCYTHFLSFVSLCLKEIASILQVLPLYRNQD